ncbi:MAG: heat shock protein Hsp20 [Chloroflexi bacterium]|jgi:HSP20 family protein|nr:heat shock protein Hsp20 [Chloroflexota bacterium]
MSMERWNPFRELENMRHAMDRWLEDRGLNNAGFAQTNQSLSLAVDLHVTEKGYELTAAMPGVKPENVEINIDRDLLTVRGQTQQEEEHRQGNYLYRERHVGSYQRSIRLPEPVNPDQVDATLEDGVLRLTLPSLQQTLQRKINVRPGPDTSQQLNKSNFGATEAPTSGGQSMTNQRPDILNNLSTTQMNEVENQVAENDRKGFNMRAEMFGWDRETADQVWHYMTHRVTKDEVKRAFGNEGQQ